ncbi:MAG TPA: XRE family transcriptional regulator [Thermoguttaceae bacterium]|nr:XRE family transcriptional regulator [Thermoguttaceae bacterium]
MSLAERLKWAREAMGLRLQDVFRRTEIGISTLSDFENAVREPRVWQLKRLAELYHRPLSFFLEEGPIPHQPVICWRERPSSPQVEEIEAQFLQLAEQYHRLEVLCQERQTEVSLPDWDIPPHEMTYPLVQRLAQQFRSQSQLDSCPACELLWVLEEVYQVKVFHLPFEPTGTAACAWGESFGPAILLNARNVRWRRNFDLAHELFHLLTWKTFRGKLPQPGNKPSEQEERFATCFASNLLLPPELLQQTLEEEQRAGGFTIPAIYRIAQRFDVSMEAVIWQIRFLYRMSDDWASRCIQQCKYLKDFWENRASDSPPRLPRRYEALAQKALQQGLISIGVFAQYMDITRQEALIWAEHLAEAQASSLEEFSTGETNSSGCKCDHQIT